MSLPNLLSIINLSDLKFLQAFERALPHHLPPNVYSLPPQERLLVIQNLKNQILSDKVFTPQGLSSFC